MGWAKFGSGPKFGIYWLWFQWVIMVFQLTITEIRIGETRTGI